MVTMVAAATIVGFPPVLHLSALALTSVQTHWLINTGEHGSLNEYIDCAGAMCLIWDYILYRLFMLIGPYIYNKSISTKHIDQCIYEHIDWHQQKNK